jgi:hypothetical protein
MQELLHGMPNLRHVILNIGFYRNMDLGSLQWIPNLMKGLPAAKHITQITIIYVGHEEDVNETKGAIDWNALDEVLSDTKIYPSLTKLNITLREWFSAGAAWVYTIGIPQWMKQEALEGRMQKLYGRKMVDIKGPTLHEGKDWAVSS